MLKLAGSFQKAIRNFREQHAEVKRVVLHFYKRISKRETMVLQKALREMKLDIPLVILTIYKTGSKDLVLADMNAPHRLPVSGTWYQSGYNQFLLCNNTRLQGSHDKIKSHPYPLKLYIDLVKTESTKISPDKKLNDVQWVQQLLIQVYQFSRLNWRTVSIKDIPVSIAYPEMVAQKFPYFESDNIPLFGKENLWFL